MVRHGKGQKDRVIDLTSSLTQDLRLYLKGKKPEDSVFGLAPSTISGLIRWAARRAGVGLHTHSLRDHFATSLVDEGVDLEIVRRLLGHVNLNVTTRYLARTDSQRREAIQRLEGGKRAYAGVYGQASTAHHQERLVEAAQTWMNELVAPVWRTNVGDDNRRGVHRSDDLAWEVTSNGLRRVLRMSVDMAAE